MDKYMKRSFTKLRTALAILIACCLTTDMYAQTAVAADSVVTDTVAQLVSGVNTVWMLLAAMLVFFMQPGFALVEAGFTRTKNTANILMKNFVDFMFGSLLYWLVGFGIMFGLGDFFGTPHLMSLLFDSNGLPDPASLPTEGFLVFQTVFCATSATIVSGAMAERTKFSMYLVYTIFISVLIYPVSGHWTWGGGWLMNGEAGSFMTETFGTTFHDFAGSNCIHMVGGISALIGAAMLGPRIGKFVKDKTGKVTKVNAFPGHNLPIGALGVFILWLGWYGFNGAAATSVEELGSIFVTTTIAPAIATVVTMILTWVKYGKPDVSMCVNASLAGLVAITAGCDVVDAFGSIVIGAVAGVLVVFGVWFLDYKLHVDDPVGAVAVHCLNGIWGTVAVGFFATPSAPAFARGFGDGVSFGANQIAGAGLFYGGGFKQLGLQLFGMLATIAWTAVTITIAFIVIKKLFGLRVSEEEEIVGLDAKEHGLPSAYAGFSIMDISNTMTMDVNENTDLGVSDYDKASEFQKNAAVKVVEAPITASASGIYKVVIIAKLSRFEALKTALNDLGVTGMTMTQVMGCGIQKGAGEMYRGAEIDATLLPKVKIEVVVSKIPVDSVIATAKKVLFTGHIGDGKIFVYNVDRVVKVRTGEENTAALQDVE